MRYQRHKQTVFDRREVHLFSRHENPPCLRVYAEIIGLKDTSAPLRCDFGQCAAPQRHPQTGSKLADPERLGQVVISAPVERVDLVLLPVPRGQHHDG
jgi:hypothetical protein